MFKCYPFNRLFYDRNQVSSKVSFHVSDLSMNRIQISSTPGFHANKLSLVGVQAGSEPVFHVGNLLTDTGQGCATNRRVLVHGIFVVPDGCYVITKQLAANKKSCQSELWNSELSKFPFSLFFSRLSTFNISYQILCVTNFSVNHTFDDLRAQ